MTTQLATQDNPDPHAPQALTMLDIKRYICPTATDQEAMMFLRLCQAQGLNPFVRDAYLIKYNANGAATMVVGKEAFTKRAETHPQFDGFKAGVIVKDDDGQYHYPEASFAYPDNELIGGWAEVYRKDRKMPFRVEVNITEFTTNMNQWKKMPGTMIRKVALVSALREAFPTAFAGLYDAAEMKVDTDTGEIADPPKRPARTKGEPVAQDPYDAIADTNPPSEARPATEPPPAPQDEAPAAPFAPHDRAGLELALKLGGCSDGNRRAYLARFDWEVSHNTTPSVAAQTGWGKAIGAKHVTPK